MPRDLSKSEDMSSKCNRYSPLGRRSPLDMPTPPRTPPPPVPAAPRRSEEQRRHSYVRRCPTAETPMSMFHAQLVEKLNEKIESREVQLASDAETLTADEGSDSSNDSWSSGDNWSSGDSWSGLDSLSSRDSRSSRDGWSSRDSYGSPDILGARDIYGNIYPGGFPPAPRTPDILRHFSDEGPKVVVELIPQLEEPMEIVMDEHPSPLQQLQVFHHPPAAAAVSVEDEDDDDSSETSSFWQSDEDEEIQRACLEESDEESNEDLDEASSGRVNRPQVDSPQYYYVPRTQPLSLGYAQQEQHYWPVDQLEPAQTQLAPVVPQEQQVPGREYSVELMDQDDQEPHFEQTTNVITHQLPTRPVIQYDAQARHHLVAEQGPLQERELNYPFSRYVMQPEPDNNNYIVAGDYLPHPNYRCYHCGSPHQGMLNTYQQVTLVHPAYYAPLEANRNSDFSIERLLSSEQNQ